MPTVLPNPETGWSAEVRTESDLRAIVEERVGPSFRVLQLLKGGQANLNVLLDGRQVLRVYTRDARTSVKERRLLEWNWTNIRTPGVIEAGEDFLLLEWLKLAPVPDNPVAGERIGSAAAEIHSVQFPEAGLLDSSLKVVTPLPTARTHVAETLAELGQPWARHGNEVMTLLESLDETIASSTPVLNHGDFKSSNLFFDPNGRLVVLDWEFAFSGPSLFDLGQLFRWGASSRFVRSFVSVYEATSGVLPQGWKRKSEVFDLVNLLGLARRCDSDPARCRDVWDRFQQTVTRGQ